MKYLHIVVLVVLIASVPALAQREEVIRSGRLYAQRGLNSTTESSISTDSFTATSWMNLSNSPFDPCHSPDVIYRPCDEGKSFDFPLRKTIYLGYENENPSHFPRGTLTLDGTTYNNVYFDGQLTFCQTKFTVPRLPRRGTKVMTSSFMMTGELGVCLTPIWPTGCLLQNRIFSTKIIGKGTLTVTSDIVFDESLMTRPSLSTRSMEFKFED